MLLRQEFRAPHDANGNSRRLVVIYNTETPFEMVAVYTDQAPTDVARRVQPISGAQVTLEFYKEVLDAAKRTRCLDLGTSSRPKILRRVNRR